MLAWKKGRAQRYGDQGRRRATERWQARRRQHPRGGRVPWGAEVDFAYATGYDGHGRVFVNHLVREPGCSVMLARQEQGADGA